METIVKMGKKSYETAIALAIVLAGLMACDAGATIRDGYYTDWNGVRDRARVYISTFGEFKEETYGVIMYMHKNGTTKVSLFNVEEQDDGTTQWTPMFQGSAHVIASGEAVYIGRKDRTPVLKKRMLILNPTQAGRNVGVTDEVSVVLRSQKGYSREWRRLPEDGFRLERSKHVNGYVTPVSFDGKFRLDGTTYSGKFGMREIAPGVYLLRAAVPNTETADGQKLDRSAIAVVIPILRKRAGIRNYFNLHMVSMKSGVLSDAFDSTTLEQD